jgi:hypothetical protein
VAIMNSLKSMVPLPSCNQLLEWIVLAIIAK